MLKVALLTVSLVGRAVSGPTPDDAPTVAFVDGVVASTTRAWTAAFAARDLTYKQPRVLYLRIPAGHPSRGNGYSAGVGLLIDLNDMRGLREINDPDARSVAVLIVAHEVGHHVQALLANEGVQPSAATASVLEPQADCYAGWWIGYAMRDPSFSDTGPLFAAEDLNRRLARALQVLGLLERGGVTLRREVAGDDPHGAVAQRVASIEKGLAASDPWRC